jgi:hypothetical protein
MLDLSLDEYRLMLGTQLWLKESIFSFVETLLGGTDNKNEGTIKSGIDNDLRNITEELSGKSVSRKSRVQKINENEVDLTLKKDLSEMRENFKILEQERKERKVDNNEHVDISNWGILANQYGTKAISRETNLAAKLEHYKKTKHIS